jgi:hypothetical protein
VSKRGAVFERRSLDFYPTPRSAVMPLVPHLGGIVRFAEPCSGDGDLVAHLTAARLECAYQGDLRYGRDARMLSFEDLNDADAIITNPPHERELMHQLIAHFASLVPTWLLIDWDWAATRQAKFLLGSCAAIVPIGRVKWMPGSASVGFDNYAWYQFVKGWSEGPRLLLD